MFFSFCISPNAESLYSNPEENSGTDVSSNDPESVQISENISNLSIYSSLFLLFIAFASLFVVNFFGKFT